MESSTIRLDRGLFSDDVVARTAHRYTGQCQVALHTDGADIVVVLKPLEALALPADLPGRFQNDALDERLRELVRSETHEIHSQLITAALREAVPRLPGAMP
jgi:His-Xaa-Ser system protein HxsD